MHLIDIQYLKEITTNQKGTEMHDLYFKTIFGK
jgi:hypothetical protein